MRIMRIPTNPDVYSSNVYLIRGDFNSLEDKNTLIDTGGDDSIIDEILKVNTGAGKKRVDKIILTHNHFDHTGGIKAVKEQFGSLVYAFSLEKYIDRKLYNNQILKVGDKLAQIIYTPGHSNDSVCIYIPDEQILFSGDTPIEIHTSGNTYSKNFLDGLIYLSQLKIKTIYPGHGKPIQNGQSKIKKTIEVLTKETE